MRLLRVSQQLLRCEMAVATFHLAHRLAWRYLLPAYVQHRQLFGMFMSPLSRWLVPKLAFRDGIHSVSAVPV